MSKSVSKYSEAVRELLKDIEFIQDNFSYEIRSRENSDSSNQLNVASEKININYENLDSNYKELLEVLSSINEMRFIIDERIKCTHEGIYSLINKVDVGLINLTIDMKKMDYPANTILTVKSIKDDLTLIKSSVKSMVSEIDDKNELISNLNSYHKGLYEQLFNIENCLAKNRDLHISMFKTFMNLFREISKTLLDVSSNKLFYDNLGEIIKKTVSKIEKVEKEISSSETNGSKEEVLS